MDAGIVAGAQGFEVARPGSSRLVPAAAAGVTLLLLLGAGLLWASCADAVFLDIVTAAMPGCF